MTNVALLWENFGPPHIDECSALAAALEGRRKVIGLELFDKSETYGWGRWRGSNFEQVTLLPGRRRAGLVSTALKIVAACRRHRAKHVFLCHYERGYVLLAAWLLRILGRRVFVMSDAKFDHQTRSLRREIGKAVCMWPYRGALTASMRSADYLRFLGIDPRRIRLGYDAVSLERIRGAVSSVPTILFEERPFIAIARLIPEKNHRMMLEAYALYAHAAPRPRRLVLVGSGPLEQDVRAQIERLQIGGLVDLCGNVAAGNIPGRLAASLCLLLPSVQDQFGIAVVEAQALGLPVIVSTAVGARDIHVRTGVNGFVVEPDNAEGMAWCMSRLAEDPALWKSFSDSALAAAVRSDVASFVTGAVELIEDRGESPIRAD